MDASYTHRLSNDLLTYLVDFLDPWETFHLSLSCRALAVVASWKNARHYAEVLPHSSRASLRKLDVRGCGVSMPSMRFAVLGFCAVCHASYIGGDFHPYYGIYMCGACVRYVRTEGVPWTTELPQHIDIQGPMSQSWLLPRRFTKSGVVQTLFPALYAADLGMQKLDHDETTRQTMFLRSKQLVHEVMRYRPTYSRFYEIAPRMSWAVCTTFEPDAVTLAKRGATLMQIVDVADQHLSHLSTFSEQVVELYEDFVSSKLVDGGKRRFPLWYDALDFLLQSSREHFVRGCLAHPQNLVAYLERGLPLLNSFVLSVGIITRLKLALWEKDDDIAAALPMPEPLVLRYHLRDYYDAIGTLDVVDCFQGYYEEAWMHIERLWEDHPTTKGGELTHVLQRMLSQPPMPPRPVHARPLIARLDALLKIFHIRDIHSAIQGCRDLRELEGRCTDVVNSRRMNSYACRKCASNTCGREGCNWGMCQRCCDDMECVHYDEDDQDTDSDVEMGS